MLHLAPWLTESASRSWPQAFENVGCGFAVALAIVGGLLALSWDGSIPRCRRRDKEDD